MEVPTVAINKVNTNAVITTLHLEMLPTSVTN
jgi:hypothetical protein